MKPIDSNRQRWIQHRSVPITITLSVLLLTGCSAGSLYDYSPDATLPQDDPYATPSTASPEASPDSQPDPIAAEEFDFPQATCGDKAAEEPSQTWYIVYIDGANPDEIRREYCQDAIGTLRDDSDAPTVQVASFTEREKAVRFAKAVGGEVEEVANDATDAQTNPRDLAIDRSPARDSQVTALVGESAFLSAQESGSPINIRARASTSAPVEFVGQVGDQVQVSDRVEGTDGYTWYRVKLESGQEGWVRSDFVLPEQVAEESAEESVDHPATSRPSASVDRVTRNGNDDRATDDRATDDRSPEADPATLTSRDPNSRINIRDDANVSARVRYIGYAGDPVQISDTMQAEDGYTWYYVEFESGAVGWVRGDFVTDD